jgi:hypothetical protein
MESLLSLLLLLPNFVVVSLRSEIHSRCHCRTVIVASEEKDSIFELKNALK